MLQGLPKDIDAWKKFCFECVQRLYIDVNLLVCVYFEVMLLLLVVVAVATTAVTVQNKVTQPCDACFTYYVKVAAGPRGSRCLP